MKFHVRSVLLTSRISIACQLPLPCVSNSRYMTAGHLTGIMAAVGFEKERERWKEGGKMAYWLFRKASPAEQVPPASFEKKVVLREGQQRNNFCILL